MSANTWLIIAIIGFSLSGIALIAAVIMFIRLNIPAIIGDLTGRTVAREIKAMRDTNASSGDKRFRPSAVNLERGTLTEKVLSDNDTEVLSDNATEVLDTNATEVLSDGTEVLSNETTVLSPTEQLKTDASKPVAFKIKHDEVVTHSDEVIE